MQGHTSSINRYKSLVNKDTEKWQVYWQNLKQTIPGSQEEKQSTLRKRILKFFKGFKMDEQTCYNQRRDIRIQLTNEAVICQDVLMLYGIDYLSNEKIKEYFNNFECQVQRIDYSHCLVVFTGDGQTTLQALFLRLVNRPANLQMLTNQLSENKNELVTWREIVGYKQLCFQRKIWARFVLQEELRLIPNNFQKKDLDAYQLAKQEFMDKLDKINRRKNLDNNYSKKSAEKQCQCCAIKLNKLKEMLTCCHKTHHGYKKNYKRRERSRQRDRSRSRDKDKRNKKYSFNVKALKDVQPLDVIKKLTDPSTKAKLTLEQKLNHSSFISKIDKEDDQEEDTLYRDMIFSLEKYRISGEDEGITNISRRSRLNSSKYSVYEQQNEDEDS